MALTISDISVGDEVVIPAFKATVVQREDLDNVYCTKVQDEDGFAHWVYRNKLSKPVPYEDGTVYKNTYTEYYAYVAAGDGFSQGKWLPVDNPAVISGEYDSSDLVGYNTPSRPMQKVIFGEELND